MTGIVAGVGATAVMNLVQRTCSYLATGKSGSHGAQSAKASSKSEGSDKDATTEAASVVSQSVFGRNLPGHIQKASGTAVHYSFGTATGLFYALLADRFPEITMLNGLPFGAAVWVAADLVVVPKLSLSRKLTCYPAWVFWSSLGAHLTYGTVAETIRKSGRGLFEMLLTDQARN